MPLDLVIFNKSCRLPLFAALAAVAAWAPNKKVFGNDLPWLAFGHDASFAHYVGAVSSFQRAPMHDEAKSYAEIEIEFEGARLIVLKDFRVQTFVSIERLKDRADTSSSLDLRFTRKIFDVFDEHIDHGDYIEIETSVTSFIGGISDSEFERTIAELRYPEFFAAYSRLEERKADPPPVCLHSAVLYFEYFSSDEKGLLSRGACETGFGELMLFAKPLFQLAYDRMPQARHGLDYLSALYDEIDEEPVN